MKKVMLHLAIWVTWYSATNSSYIRNYHTTRWGPAFYNFISLAIVFYISYLLVKSYAEQISLSEGLKKSRKSRFVYFFIRPQIAGLVILSICHIILSWYADHLLYGQQLQFFLSEDFSVYAEAKFARQSLYLVTGMSYSIISFLLRRKNEIIAAKDAFIELQKIRLKAKDGDNKFLRQALEEREERIQLIKKFYLRHRS
ncbi:MAG: hypothetical protein JNM68_06360 [Dinghuibacter sp.]|nr:hypothetical protein [Dinghuibacter sp.]